MKRIALLVAFLILCCRVQAHVGSPDVFYEGPIGPYNVHVTVRMPTVVPGKAEIIVRTEGDQPATVTYCPIYSRAAISNAPPADAAMPVPGETNLYSGELWLMTFGAYSIEIKLHGSKGDGSLEVPVNSVALSQMPLPSFLGKLLIVLAAVLFFGGIAIVAAAARDSELAPGSPVSDRARNKGRIAAVVTCFILVFILFYGNKWWRSEEQIFQSQLQKGSAPDLTATVRTIGSQRVLKIALAKNSSDSGDPVDLLPDHGKLLHCFLVRDGARDAFAHLHPIRKAGKAFEVNLPPLPPGKYEIFCDLTFEKSGFSATATNMVDLPAIPAGNVSADADIPARDPDDSWAGAATNALPPVGAATNRTFTFPNGDRITWKSSAVTRAHHDAALQFEITDASGHPIELEPYMGMLSHAAILRNDGQVFAHLHPAGNFSMAAQYYFENKLCGETGSGLVPVMNHAALQKVGGTTGPALVSIPYEFPTSGPYRIWTQFKTHGEILTAVFDTSVAD